MNARARRAMAALLVGVLVALTQAIAGEAQSMWTVSLSLDSDQPVFALREPVPLRVTWTNSTAAEQILAYVIPELIVGRGGMTEQLVLFETSESQVEDRPPPQTKVKPQESFSFRYWLLLGAPKGSTSWRFLFDKEGDWSVAWPSDEKAKVDFKVVKPAQSEEKAFALMSLGVAEVMLGEKDGPVEAKRSALELIRQFPDSIYAPYILLTLARPSVPPFDVTKEELTKALAYFVAHRPRHLLAEEALAWLIPWSMEPAKFPEVCAYFEILTKNHPRSQHIEGFRQRIAAMREILQRPPLEPLGKASVQLMSIDKLPAQVGPLVERYWNAWAARDLLALGEVMAEDGLFDGTNFAERKQSIELYQDWMNLVSLKVQVTNCEAVEECSSTNLLTGQKRIYKGPGYVLTAAALRRWRHPVSGKQYQLDFTHRIACVRRGDRWWLAFTEVDFPNKTVAPLAIALERAVRSSFGEVKTRTKEGQVLLADAIGKKLGAEILRWLPEGMEMTGEAFDVPVLRGCVAGKTKEGGEFRARVSLRFVYKEGELYLDNVAVVPEGSDQPAGEEALPAAGPEHP